jgi:hypothetical protein
VKALALPLQVALLAGGTLAVAAPSTASAQVAVAAQAPVTLVVDLAPGGRLDPERLRDAIGRELGVPVVWQRDAAGGTLVVRQEGARVVVSFDRPDGKHDGRALALADDPTTAERDVALLAGNVARDQAAQFERPPPPAAAPPPAHAPPARPAPPPAPRVSPCQPVGPTLPAAIDFVPYVGVSTADQGQSVRNASFGVLGALSGGVKGAAVSSVVDIASGPLCGVQVSGVVSVAGPSVGVQVAGITSVAQSFRGLQVGGIANVAQSLHGLQVAGAANVVAEDSTGMQVAAVNVDDGRLRGVQIGAFNYARHADLQLGLVNIVADGRFLLDAWTKPEMGLVLAGVEHGGAHYHWIYALGTRPADVARPWAGIGFGAHITPGDNLYVDLDGLAYAQLDFASNQVVQLDEVRVVVGVRLLPELALFAGPTLSLTEQGSAARSGAPAYADNLGSSGSSTFLLWPGVVLGVEGL